MNREFLFPAAIKKKNSKDGKNKNHGIQAVYSTYTNILCGNSVHQLMPLYGQRFSPNDTHNNGFIEALASSCILSPFHFWHFSSETFSLIYGIFFYSFFVCLYSFRELTIASWPICILNSLVFYYSLCVSIKRLNSV